MQPEHGDDSYLWDMLDACRTVFDFVGHRTFHEYASDRMLRAAIERYIEIIGEAARNVSASFRDEHPEIPWQKIISQRNVLAHEYGEIEHERIWVVAKNRIPELIVLLEPLVPEAPD